VMQAIENRVAAVLEFVEARFVRIQPPIAMARDPAPCKVRCSSPDDEGAEGLGLGSEAGSHEARASRER
jgi:hypothetical protein